MLPGSESALPIRIRIQESQMNTDPNPYIANNRLQYIFTINASGLDFSVLRI